MLLRFVAPALLTVVIGVPGVGCDASEETGPTAIAARPAAASRGEAVYLIGERFCGDAASDSLADGSCAETTAAFVSFGGGHDVLRADALMYSNDQIVVTVPDTAPVGETFIVIVREGSVSNPLAFRIQ